jgi:hypothetical protein
LVTESAVLAKRIRAVCCSLANTYKGKNKSIYELILDNYRAGDGDMHAAVNLKKLPFMSNVKNLNSVDNASVVEDRPFSKYHKAVTAVLLKLGQRCCVEPFKTIVGGHSAGRKL